MKLIDITDLGIYFLKSLSSFYITLQIDFYKFQRGFVNFLKGGNLMKYLFYCVFTTKINFFIVLLGFLHFLALHAKWERDWPGFPFLGNGIFLGRREREREGIFYVF